LILNLIFLLVTSILTVIAGGDYSGTKLIRYQFPFLIVIILLCFLLLHSLSKTLNEIFLNRTSGFWGVFRIINFLTLQLVALTSILFFKPNSFNTLIDDIKQVDRNGRVTCDAAAGFAISKTFPHVHTIATSEVNGIPYHSDKRLIDLIGLVDPNIKTDGFVGDALHKFRVTQNTQDIMRTDLLWPNPAAECATSKNQLTSEDKYGERLQNLVKNHIRIVNFSLYENSGFIPYVVTYSFNSAGVKMYGNAFMFSRSNLWK
jgi:hypothetical protein